MRARASDFLTRTCRRHLLPLFTALLVLAWPFALASSAAVECRWTGHPILLDGKADEPAWQSAHWITGFQVLGSGAVPLTRSRAALLWDREALYFYAELEDLDVFGDVLRHDGPTWNNDVFELFFQPDRTQGSYYEFQASSLNTRFDMLVTRSGNEFHHSADAHRFDWETAVVVRGTLNQRDDRDQGWSVEGRIPWSSFRNTGGRPSPGAEWAFLLARYDYTLGVEPELSSTALLPTGGFHQPEAWGALRFVGPATEPSAAWQNLRLVGTPEPPPPFRAVRAYPNLRPEGPVAVQAEPESHRILFLENFGYGQSLGRLRRFSAHPEVSNSELLLELNEWVYSFTLHPEFTRNGFIYLGVNGPNPSGQHQTRIVRYTMERTAPFRVQPESRRVIIEWPSHGHNGGASAFGPDGLFYVSSGDGTSSSDSDDAAQDLSSWRGKVFRIELTDGAEDAPAYTVPSDNPFRNVEGALPEIWAYGVRNPWRMTSDLSSGQIWIGDNGQDLRESVYLLGRGQNYGWSAYEGSRPFLPARLRGPAPLTLPIAEHDHSTYRSLTGGLVYRGRAFPELEGAYIYGDFTTGRINALKHDGSELLWQRELADTPLAITWFGEDTDGELLIADYGGGFYRLAPLIPKADAPPFARKLSETGLFADVATETPAPGVLPYALNFPGWHDGALGKHWMAFPEGARMQPFEGSRWMLANGMAAVQTLALETSAGPRRIETRVLLKQENDWTAYSYLWNEAQTDADLAPAEGERIQLELPAGRRAWLVPSRSECLVCHSRAANFALTATTWQLNRPIPGGEENQLLWLERHGLIESGANSPLLPASPALGPKFAAIHDTRAPVLERSRAYLAVNCAHCHTPDGGGNSTLNLLPEVDLAATGLLNEVPRHGTFRMRDPRIITPGVPGRSVLVTRMALRIPGQMPPIGSARPDIEGVRLLAEWISSMNEAAPR